MNRFNESAKKAFQARKVRVLAEDGVGYTGWVENFDTQYKHFLLYDAERDDGESLDAVMVPHADRVELIDHEITIEAIPIDDLQPSPYATREFEAVDNNSYIKDVQERDGRRSFPTVRRSEDGYEAIDGNKSLWVCKKADVDSQPCRVVERSDWEAAKQFVYNHLPTSSCFDEAGKVERGWYAEKPAEEAIRRLYSDWGDRILQLHPVAYNVDRLDLDLDSDG